MKVMRQHILSTIFVSLLTASAAFAGTVSGTVMNRTTGKPAPNVTPYSDGAETPEATRAFVQAQYELWGKVVREIGLQPE